MRPLYSHSTRENVTPSGGISPLASCMGVPPPPLLGFWALWKFFVYDSSASSSKGGWILPRTQTSFSLGKAGRKGKEGACRLYPSHGHLQFITSHSSTLRKEKRLRRRLGWISTQWITQLRLCFDLSSGWY